MLQNESLITKWAPALLLMELDEILWKDSDHIQIKQLWDYMCTYCYLPRLANFGVLEDSIRNGVNSTEYFALAAGIVGDKYLDLKYNEAVSSIDKSAYLVKILTALKQKTSEQSASSVQPQHEEAQSDQSDDTKSSVSHTNETKTPSQIDRRFYMSAELDNTRIGRDVQRLVEEVINHISSLDNCNLNITLEVSAERDEGFSTTTIRTVSENCRTLKVKDFGFEK